MPPRRPGAPEGGVGHVISGGAGARAVGGRGVPAGAMGSKAERVRETTG